MIVYLLCTLVRSCKLTEEVTWKTIALMTKGGGYLCGIGLVEVIWKRVAIIMNNKLGQSE